MAAKLQVRLTFEGGEEMKKALADIGVKGGANLKGLASAADSVGAAFGALGDVIKTVSAGIVAIGGAVGAATAGVIALAKSSAEAADQAGKTAQKVGINAQEYQRLAFAAKLADVEQDTLTVGLTQLNKNIIAATEGNGELLDTFRALKVGIGQFRALITRDPITGQINSFKLLSKSIRPANDVLLDLADRFKQLKDGPLKAAIAVQLFGKSGAELIPLLNSGKKEIQGLGQEADRLGLVFSDKAIKSSEEFNDTLSVLEGAITGVKNAVGQVFIPELTNLAKLLTDFVVKNRDAIVEWVQKGWNFLKQVVLDIVAIFQGRDADVVNTWLLTARDNLTKALDVAVKVGDAILRILKFFGLLQDEQQKAADKAALSDAVAASRAPFGNATALQRFASGGHVHGPGTGTSDSILARLSKGEFVIRSAVVQSLGAPFLHALNNGMVPAFAGGGQVGGRPVNLHLDGQSFGMTAGEGVVAQLTRAARKRSLASPGRSPSWKTRR